MNKLFWFSAGRDLPYFGQICGLGQGMPLGIELAAAWVSLLSMADIVAEIRQSQALSDNPVLADQDIRLEQAFTLLQMGQLVLPGNFDEAMSWYDQSLALYQALPDPWGAAQALAAPAEAHVGGEDTMAKERFEKSLALRRWLGDKRGIADNLVALSTLAPDVVEVAQLQGRGLDLWQTAGRAAQAEVGNAGERK